MLTQHSLWQSYIIFGDLICTLLITLYLKIIAEHIFRKPKKIETSSDKLQEKLHNHYVNFKQRLHDLSSPYIPNFIKKSLNYFNKTMTNSVTRRTFLIVNRLIFNEDSFFKKKPTQTIFGMFIAGLTIFGIHCYYQKNRPKQNLKRTKIIKSIFSLGKKISNNLKLSDENIRDFIQQKYLNKDEIWRKNREKLTLGIVNYGKEHQIISWHEIKNYIVDCLTSVKSTILDNIFYEFIEISASIDYGAKNYSFNYHHLCASALGFIVSSIADDRENKKIQEFEKIDRKIKEVNNNQRPSSKELKSLRLDLKQIQDSHSSPKRREGLNHSR